MSPEVHLCVSHGPSHATSARPFSSPKACWMPRKLWSSMSTGRKTGSTVHQIGLASEGEFTAKWMGSSTSVTKTPCGFFSCVQGEKELRWTSFSTRLVSIKWPEGTGRKGPAGSKRTRSSWKRGKCQLTARTCDDLTVRIEARLVRVVVDAKRALIDEWKRTCNEELVQVLVARWEAVAGLYQLGKDGVVSGPLNRKLRELGFGCDTVDKLVLRIAIATTDRVILSDDSGFWDPKRESTGWRRVRTGG